MVRAVRVTVPLDRGDQIASVLAQQAVVHDLQYSSSRAVDRENNVIETCTYYFKAVEKKMAKIVKVLGEYGVGTAYGSIDVSSLAACKPPVSTYKHQGRKRKRKYRLDDALSIDEVRALVETQYHLTFDYLAFVAAGGLIAAVGLLQDSSTSVVASMLVSPLMGPIVGMTFGTIIRDWKMFRTSFRNEIIGIIICFVVGSLVAFFVSPFIDAENDVVMASNSESSGRGSLTGILGGVFIAIPSGCGVGLGVTSDSINPLVGCAISAALLPPIVNSGLALCLGVMFKLNGKENHIVKRHLDVGSLSFCLFLVNWCLIYVFALVIFRIKQLHAHVDDPKKMEGLRMMTQMDVYGGNPDGFDVPLLSDITITQDELGNPNSANNSRRQTLEDIERQDTFTSLSNTLSFTDDSVRPRQSPVGPTGTVKRMRMQSLPAVTGASLLAQKPSTITAKASAEEITVPVEATKS